MLISLMIAICLAEDVSPRLPIPSKEQIEKATRAISEVFGADLRAKSDTARVELARKLLQDAGDQSANPPEQYAMLTEAMRLASESGEINVAFSAVDRLAAIFAIENPFKDKLALLKQCQKHAKSTKRQLEIFRAYIGVVESAVRDDDYRSALDSIRGAEAITRKIKSVGMRDKIRDIEKRVRETEKQYEDVRELLRDGEQQDPESCERVGSFRCFWKNDWETGLSLLAKAADPMLKDLASKELSKPDSVEDQLFIGDGWWERAEKMDGAARQTVRTHALEWYKRALPSLQGLQRSKMEKRINDYEKPLANDDFEVELVKLEAKNIKLGAFSLTHGPVQLKGVEIRDYLYMHPPSEGESQVVFSLNEAYSILVGVVAMNDTGTGEDARTPFTFQVVGDGAVLWESRKIQKNGESQDFEVSIAKVKSLTLVVKCPGNAYNCHAVWVNPTLYK